MLLGDSDYKLLSCFLQLSNLHGGVLEAARVLGCCVCLGGDTAGGAGPPPSASRDKGPELGDVGSLHSLSGCGMWGHCGPCVLVAPISSSVPAGTLCLLMTVSPGLSQGQAENGCLINMCWTQECLQTPALHFTVYKTPSHLLSHRILPTTLRGRSLTPSYRGGNGGSERGSDMPKVT